LTPQQATTAVGEYTEKVNGMAARFRHALSDLSTVLDYYMSDVKYEVIYHPDQMFFGVNIYTMDYEEVLRNIKKYRPRLIVNQVETRGEFCSFDLDFNNNWNEEPVFKQPKIILKENVEEEMMKMSAFQKPGFNGRF